MSQAVNKQNVTPLKHFTNVLFYHCIVSFLKSHIMKKQLVAFICLLAFKDLVARKIAKLSFSIQNVSPISSVLKKNALHK